MPVIVGGKRIRLTLGKRQFRSIRPELGHQLLHKTACFDDTELGGIHQISLYNPRLTPAVKKAKPRIVDHTVNTEVRNATQPSSSHEEDAEQIEELNKKHYEAEDFSLLIEDENGERLRQISVNTARKLSEDSEQKFAERRKEIQSLKQLPEAPVQQQSAIRKRRSLESSIFQDDSSFDESSLYVSEIHNEARTKDQRVSMAFATTPIGPVSKKSFHRNSLRISEAMSMAPMASSTPISQKLFPTEEADGMSPTASSTGSLEENPSVRSSRRELTQLPANHTLSIRHEPVQTDEDHSISQHSVSLSHKVENSIGKENVQPNISVLIDVESEEPICYEVRFFDDYMGAEEDYFNKLLHLVEQAQAISWNEFGPILRPKKLGEGGYGEVYKTVRHGHNIALKVVPLDCPSGYRGSFNGGKMSSPADSFPEVMVSKALSLLRDQRMPHATDAFVQFHGAAIIKGRYPKKLTKAWSDYAAKKKTYNEPSPEEYGIDGQLYLAISLQLAGMELELFNPESEPQGVSIFAQVLLALAVAEKAYEFEHRDLHLSNILCNMVKEDARFRLENEEYVVKSHGVNITIIDFSLSRFRSGTSVTFHDLEGEDLFSAKGCLQYDIYRWMRDACSNDWSQYTPNTNVYWLYHLGHELFKKDFKKKISPRRKKEISAIMEIVKECNSAQDALKTEEVRSLLDTVIVSNK